MAASSSSKSVIDFLEGKNVFVFDTETTGLPDRVPGAKWGTSSEYWNYTINEKYERSRIVSIAWAFVRSFDKVVVGNETIQHYIRYPDGFNDIPTTHIHGISFETALRQGIPFCDIFENCGLYENLMRVDYIVAHNVNFDVHILLNELHRLDTDNATNAIRHILNLLSLGRCICTGDLGKDICKLEYKSKFKPNVSNQDTDIKLDTNKKCKRYKMPKLVELYKHFYGCEFEDAHNAEGDVRALLKCLQKM